jgi:phosphoglycolate phosphatase
VTPIGPRWRERPLRAVLFDLDGTLLDTLADIALALNRALAAEHWPPVPIDAVRAMIGRGSPSLVRRAAQYLGRAPDDAQQARILENFFAQYGALHERGERAARPFAGATAALERLHAAGLKIAIVTNKQFRFADALIRDLGLARWVDLVVGGDTCERRKPDPQPLLHACRQLGVAPTAALMVGDSANDVGAARAAAMPIVCVPYGYDEGRDPRLLAGDALIESLAELPAMLLGGARGD